MVRHRVFHLLLLLFAAWTDGVSQGTLPQHIDLSAPGPEVPANAAPFQILAPASSYLPVKLAVEGPAALDGRTVTLTGVGGVKITATQAGNAEYAPASAEITLQSAAVAPTLETPSIDLVYGTPFTASLLATAASAAPFTDPAANRAAMTGELGTSFLGVNGAPTYLPDNPLFRYENNVLSPSEDPHSAGGWASNVLKPPYGPPYRVAFSCDCSRFEMVLQARGELYRLWVDGKYAAADATRAFDAYPAKEFIEVSFPDKRSRQIKFWVDSNAPFFGVNTTGGDTLAAPEAPLGQRVMIFGDSWTGPTIRPPAVGPPQPGLLSGGYPETLGEYFNWDYWTDGIGGTGFTNYGVDAYQRTFTERAATDICPNGFEAVVIMGGVNEGSATDAQIRAGVSATLSQIRGCLPNAPVYVYGPQNVRPGLPDDMAAGVASVAGIHSYTDMTDGTPWFYGDPTISSYGNNYFFFNLHPTPAGHDYLAERIAADLITRFPALKPSPHTLGRPAPVAGHTASSAADGTLLPAGDQTVSVTFTPDDTTRYAAASGTAAVRVMQATTTIQVTKPQSGPADQIVAAVLPQIRGTPTGTVRFSDNGAPLGTAALGNGTAAFVLGPGRHSIAARYGGDGNFLPAATGAPLIVTVTAPPPPPPPPDFALKTDTSAVTVASNTAASVELTISPMNGFEGAVVLACAGLPQDATCSFASPSIGVMSGPVSVKVTFQAAGGTARLWPRLFRSGSGALPFLAGAVLLGRTRRGRKGLFWPAAVAALMLAACGTTLTQGGGQSGPAPPASSPGSVTQSTVQLQATANAGTPQALTHSQAVVLTVE